MKLAVGALPLDHFMPLPRRASQFRCQMARVGVLLLATLTLGFEAALAQTPDVVQLSLVEVSGTRVAGSANRGVTVGSFWITQGPAGSTIRRPRKPVGETDPGKSKRAEPVPTDNSKLEDCNSSSSGSTPTTLNPVVISTGEKIKEETDFLSFGQYGLSHQRTYRRNYPGSGMFGAYWWSSLSYPKLVTSGCFSSPDWGCEPTTVQLWKPDGSRDVYQHIAGTDGPALYSAAGSTSGGTLAYFPTVQWVLTRDRTTYTYSTAGYLKNISGPMGLSIGFTYSTTTPSQLLRVTNNVGQSVMFTWSAGHVVSVTDPAGGVWTYTYNATGLLETVTSPGAVPDVRRYHYESPVSASLLTGISINGVRYSTYAYNSAYRTIESGLAGGEERDTFAYGTNTTTVTSATGQATTYNFASVNGALRLTSTSRAATSSCPAAAASIVYDANGYIDYKLDWNGNKTDYNFDSTGRLIDLVTAAGTSAQLTTTNAWNGIDLAETAFKDSAGTSYAKVAYTYVTTGPATGRLASETWTDFKVPTQRQTLYGYAFYANNAVSTLTVTRVLPTGNAATTSSYDTLGNLTSVTNPLGQQTAWSSFNGYGQPGRMTDANGVMTDYAYDGKGNLASTLQYLPGGNRLTTYAYNNDHQVSDITYAGGRVDRARYNAAGRLEYAGNALGEYVRRAFDVASNTLTTSSSRNVPGLSGGTPVATPSGQFSATRRFDSLRRPWVDMGNNGQQLSYAYDKNGNLKSATDAAARTTRYDYDAQDRLIKVTAADNGITIYNYNSEGRLQYVEDPRNLRTNYTYDGFGQMRSQASPDSGATNYSYDAAGRLTSETRANGVAISYSWDALDRRLARTNGGVTETFTYDEGTYGKGRFTSFNDVTGQTTLEYSAAGELVRKVSNIFGTNYATTWSYNAAGQLTGMGYPSHLAMSAAFSVTTPQAN